MPLDGTESPKPNMPLHRGSFALALSQSVHKAVVARLCQEVGQQMNPHRFVGILLQKPRLSKVVHVEGAEKDKDGPADAGRWLL